MTKTTRVISFSGNSAPSTFNSYVRPSHSLTHVPKYTTAPTGIITRKPVIKSIGIFVDYEDPQPKEHENVPSFVKATFTNDINIFKIHSAIKTVFEDQLFNIDKMKLKIEDLSGDLRVRFLSLVDAKRIGNEIDALDKKIKSLETHSGWRGYVEKVRPILDRYLPLASDETKGVINFTSDIKHEDSEILEKRLKTIEEYIKIAGCYIPMDITSKTRNSSNCPGCDKDTSDHVDISDGILECECGYQQINVIKHSTFKDSNRVNVSGRSDYDDRTTFIKALDHFFGVKTTKIPERLYEMLDEYFAKCNLPSGEYVRNNVELLADGKRKGTSVDLLIKALSATSNANYYSQVNCIAAVYWGWVLPDISHLRDKVIYDYDETQKVYMEVKERESSLNIQIRLYLHLNALGCSFLKTDFKMPASPDSLAYHNKMWYIMCERTHVKYTPFI